MGFSLSEFLRKGDIFARVPGLNISGQTVYKTKTGTLFTVIYLLVLISVVVVQVRRYLDRTNPATSSENYSHEEYPRINLTKNKIVPAIIAYYNDTLPFSMDELKDYMTIKAYSIKWTPKEVNYSAGEYDDTLKVRDEIPIITCKELIEKDPSVFDFYDKDSPTYQTLIDFGMCVDSTHENFYINGKGTDDLWEQISIFIKPCSDAYFTYHPDGYRITNSFCPEIEDLQAINFIITTPLASYDYTNHDNPVTYIPNFDDIYYMNPTATQLYTAKVRNRIIKDYTGLFAKWTDKLNFFEIGQTLFTQAYRDYQQYGCVPEAMWAEDENYCRSYFIYTLQASGEIQINKRAYVTIFDVLGSIGGINGILILILGAAYQFVNVRRRNIHLVNAVYPLIFAKQDTLNAQGEKVEEKKPSGCCRRKTKEEKEAEKKENEKINIALSRIQSCLDIRNMVEDSYKTNVLAAMFLKKRHIGLAQIVDLNNWKEHVDHEAAVSNEVAERLKRSKANILNRKAKLKKVRADMALRKLSRVEY
jgi:hypothetical protein